MAKRILATLLLLLTNTIVQAAPIKVGLVLDKGGKDDRSFNSAAYMGATKAEKDLKIYPK